MFRTTNGGKGGVGAKAKKTDNTWFALAGATREKKN